MAIPLILLKIVRREKDNKMPYGDIYKKGSKYCFKNKDTGRERCSSTKEKSQKQLNLLRGIEHGMSPRS